MFILIYFYFFFSSRRRHTRFKCDWSSDVCSSDLSPSTDRCRDMRRAPRPPSTATPPSRIAEGVGRRVAAFEANLMRPFAVEGREEIRIDRHATSRRAIDLRDPAAHALRIKMRVPRSVQRIRYVNAPPVAAQLDHLRRAVEWPALRMLCVRHDPAQPHATRL